MDRRRPPLRRAWAAVGLAVGLLVGCAPAPAEIDAASEAGGGDGCGERPDDVVLQAACPIAVACPAVRRYGDPRCPGPLDAGAPYSSDERCVLDHLSSGAPGTVIVEGACGEVEERLTITVIGPGEAILVVASTEPDVGGGCPDGVTRWGPVEACELASPGAFSGCLAASTASSRAACMIPERWFVGCGATSPRCVGDPG